MIKKTLIINGITRSLLVNEDDTLASVLRERLLLTGCKIGCGEGHCGACNVIMDGKVTRSCIVKMKRVRDNAEITTIEGVGTISDMHPLQVAWMAYGCAQCGFCSPGFIISAKVLLDNNPNPTREEVRNWFDKNRNLFTASVILIAGIGGLSISFGKVTITEVACALILGIITNVVLSGKNKNEDKGE